MTGLRGKIMGTLDGAWNLVRFLSEQWKRPDELRKLQEKRLKNALEQSYGAPFYRKMMDAAHLNPAGGKETLQELPLTAKEDIQRDPDSFLTSAENLGNDFVHETTGSTGKPLRVRLDRNSSTIRTSLLFSNLFSCGIRPFSLTAQLVFKKSPAQYAKLRSYGILPRISLDILDDARKNLEIIRRAKAEALCYYPSATTLLARANLESGKPLRLKRVLSGSELLTPDWRRLLEESFSCPVSNLYGCWEFGPIAFECPEEHCMHVNTGTFHMEILDSHNRNCAKGTGRVVLTSLCNSAMPLVRFDLGDLASWGGQCPCGRGLPVLKSLEGRADDMVVLPSGKLQSPLTFRFTDLECVAKGILMYQLVQEKEGLFVFRYVPSATGLPEGSKKDIVSRISAGCLGETVVVEFEQVGEIKRNRRGKLDRLISKVSRRRSIRAGGGPS
jgi:phenylacetate-CoA ligase